jgi:pullulanase
MNKRILGLFLGAMLVLPIVSCGPSKTSSEAADSSSQTGSLVPSSSTKTSTSYAPIEPVDPPTYEEESIQVHYLRPDGNYSAWALWIWSKGNSDGKLYQFNGQYQANGAIASYKLSDLGASGVSSTGTIGFIVRNATGDWKAKDPDGDRFADLSEYPADAKKIHHIYLKTADSEVYYSPDYKIIDAIKTAYFTSMSRLYIETSNPIVSYQIFENGTTLIKEATLPSPSKGAVCVLNQDIDLGKSYSAKVTFAQSQASLTRDIAISNLYKTPDFDAAYTYSGSDLGAVYAKTGTSFKVWSPFSSEIKVRLYNSGTPKAISETKGDDTFVEYPLAKGEKGVWSATVDGDLAGRYYTYVVTNGQFDKREIVDPYAKSAGINGLRGMIVDFSATNPSGWDSVTPWPYDRKSLAIYETHVADLTSSATWTSDSAARAKEKTFAGASLSGTTYTGNGVTVKTGFDHIKELGVNAVELLPIFDQANDEVNPSFNWGYNPLNYNCIEGSYSSDPYDGYARIREFKELVKAYHDASINVIMDVVYNHVNAASGSNWDVLVPGYFYRYQSNGSLYNGSGCGNEVASELPMTRKFIVDSTAFWASEYKLGGFRFDLMALIDMPTMNALASNLKTILPTIAVFGEPWTGGDSGLDSRYMTNAANILSWGDYGGFNDKMRDGLIAGGLAAVTDKSWVTQTAKSSDTSKILGGIRGQTLTTQNMLDPNKTVNYASCHDNYPLYDRVKAANITDETSLHYMPVLANSVVFSSNGTSFMLAGEELLRSKIKYEEKDLPSNSYNSSYRCNEIDYARKVTFPDVFRSYQKLIELKKNCAALHLEQNATLAGAFPIDVSADSNQIAYTLNDTANSKIYRVIHNNGYGTLPVADLSGYSVYLDTREQYSRDSALSSSTSFLPFETLIAVKAA